MNHRYHTPLPNATLSSSGARALCRERDCCTLGTSGRAAFLSQAFQGFSADEWVERLHAADIGVAICNNIDALRAENTRLADGSPGTQNGSYSFSYYPNHPSGHEVTQLDPYAVRTAVGPVNALQPTEKFGSSTRDILEELGYGQEAIKKLLLSGDISDSWSEEYLPS